MKCNFCKYEVEEGSVYCPNCGTTFNTTHDWNKEIKEKEFYKLPEVESYRKEFKSNAVTLIALIVVEFVFLIVRNLLASSILAEFTISGIILDAVIMLIIDAFYYFKRSRVAAVLMGVYSLFNTAVIIQSTGRMGGYLYIIVAVFFIRTTFAYHKALKKYRETGEVEEFSHGSKKKDKKK